MNTGSVASGACYRFRTEVVLQVNSGEVKLQFVK